MRNSSVKKSESKTFAVKTPAQVRAEFDRKGVGVTTWAKERGHIPQQVFAVLSGKSKAKRGKAHAIAVDLGLKEGEIA